MRPVVLSHLEFTILWESYDGNSHLPYPAYIHSQASFRLLSIWNKVLVPQPLSPKSLVPAYAVQGYFNTVTCFVFTKASNYIGLFELLYVVYTRLST